ncbi:hypothetical protein NGB36_11275 [Streptomyces sp. RB6PN25]|uniref:Uncharacterized protein n=1 Tax=Streptomyces humicola TaxID=2953240 RepID=A0ABT1PU02_9ACTN|nr:hypothetical protein [Streptomyces humicola]
MGWTHDYRDVSRNHHSTAASGQPSHSAVLSDELPERGQLLAIPRILGRRARWVSARLRHSARS